MALKSRSAPVFDEFSASYDDDLHAGLKSTGEDKAYFLQRRLAWLHGQLKSLNYCASRTLDYGCGCGDSSPLFFNVLGADHYTGVDVSLESLSIANRRFGHSGAQFLTLDSYNPAGEMDLAYCNGVFHHIDPPERLAALKYVARSLRPGGLFAFWENNPWNPGTRFVMNRIPFDRDAQVITARQARDLLLEWF